MDRPSWRSRTDNIVVVDPGAERLLWVPRDLWCRRLRDRVNSAFAAGGHRALIGCLNDVGLSVHHSLCVSRAAVERVLADVEIEVPVTEELAFWYPLEPTRPIEEGRKIVRFSPPREVLAGERIHQWIGARFAVDEIGDDIERMARQQVFVRRLMETGFDFGRVITDPADVSVSSDAAFDDLRRVKTTWRLETLLDFVPRRIDGKAVLVKGSRRLRIVHAVKQRTPPALARGFERLRAARKRT